MGSLNKSLALILILAMTISSLIIVKPASAQSIPKPSMPEFTLKYVDYSYDVPSTSSIDPFTGNNSPINGYHVEGRTIELSIKNQPFTPTPMGPAPAASTELMYNIRVKGHFGQGWTEIWHPSDPYPRQSDSAYTVFNFSLSGLADNLRFDVNSKVQIHFQAVAMNGVISKNITEGPMGPLYFVGETSEWSNIETLSIPDGTVSSSTSTSPTISPTITIAAPTPTVPELSWLIILPLLIALFSIAVVLRHRKASEYE